MSNSRYLCSLLTLIDVLLRTLPPWDGSSGEDRGLVVYRTNSWQKHIICGLSGHGSKCDEAKEAEPADGVKREEGAIRGKIHQWADWPTFISAMMVDAARIIRGA